MKPDDVLQTGSVDVVETSLQILLSSGKKLAVFGCGQGLKTFEMFVLNKFEINVDLYIDQRFGTDDKFKGIRAVNLEGLKEINTADFNVIITISYESFKSIEQLLSGYCFQKIYSAFDFFEYHLAYVEKKLAYSLQDEISKHSDKIRSAYALLSDDESKLIFRQLLEIYNTRNLNFVKRRPLREQYLSTDVGLQKGYSKTINCGAFDGDTVKSIFAIYGRFEFLACIEPDLRNFLKLREWLDEKDAGQTVAKHLFLYPLALGSKTENIKLEAAGTNSNINSETGERNTICVKLDDIIFTDDITFINMDIEGKELEAIKGSKRIIKRSKPDLAISIYHRPSDLWDVILQLNKTCPGYRFAIRNYTGFTAETVLYATWMG